MIVSYNDPQGNHRFALPTSATLTKPADSLLGLSGAMLQNPGVDVVTTAAFNPCANSTNLVVNNPTTRMLKDAKLFLEFIDTTGTVAREVPVTRTLPPGPSVVPVAWSTADFSPAYSSSQDYIVLAFLTDYQGNILATGGPPLSSFQQDPKATLASDNATLTWNFGAAQQGTLLQHPITLASVGFQDLVTYVDNTPGVSVAGPTFKPLTPGDVATYTVNLNTDNLTPGPYSLTLPIRTSDPSAPTKTLSISGTITAAPADATGGATIRPLDYTASVSGPHAANDQVTITQTLRSPHPRRCTRSRSTARTTQRCGESGSTPRSSAPALPRPPSTSGPARTGPRRSAPPKIPTPSAPPPRARRPAPPSPCRSQPLVGLPLREILWCSYTRRGAQTRASGS